MIKPFACCSLRWLIFFLIHGSSLCIKKICLYWKFFLFVYHCLWISPSICLSLFHFLETPFKDLLDFRFSEQCWFIHTLGHACKHLWFYFVDVVLLFTILKQTKHDFYEQSKWSLMCFFILNSHHNFKMDPRKWKVHIFSQNLSPHNFFLKF